MIFLPPILSFSKVIGWEYCNYLLSLLLFSFQINDALVAPLLRLKDNNCHVEETEKALKRKDKLDELIILYETKELHKKG